MRKDGDGLAPHAGMAGPGWPRASPAMTCANT